MRDDHYAATARMFHHITHFAVHISRCTFLVAHFSLHISRCTFRAAHFALHISRCTFCVAHAAYVDVRRAGSHGPHGRGALRLVWRPIPARLPTGMPEIESLEHEHQLARIHFHVLLSRPRRHRNSERARLETFVTHSRMQALRCLRRALCASRIRSIHSADESWCAWPSGTIGMAGTSYCRSTRRRCGPFPHRGPTSWHRIRSASWASSAPSSASRTWWRSRSWWRASADAMCWRTSHEV